MEMLLVGVVILIAVLVGRKGSKTKDELKTFIASEIDALAGDEVVTQWKETDDSINQFTGTFKEVGYAAATESGDFAGVIKDAIDWFMNLIQAGNKHFLEIDKTELKRFGNVLTAGSKPLTAGVVFQFTLIRGIDQSVVLDFRAKTKAAGLQFDIYSVDGRKLSGGLAVGKYFAYGKLAMSITPNLLPAFISAALAKGETARLYWTGDAIASPPVLIVDKESLLARIDP
jgi:hypothetical protein